MLFNGALAMALRFRLVYENRKLDEKYGVSGDNENENGDGNGNGNGNLKDSNGGKENDGPNFRYIL